MSEERVRVSRSKILEGALEILDSGTYGDLTVDALARSLHMSKSTLYKYFSSKEDVVVALVDDACAEAERALDSDARLGNGKPEEGLKALVDILARHSDRLPKAVILQNQRLPAACQTRVSGTRERLSRSIREVIEKGAKTGAFKVEHAGLAAESLVAGAEAGMSAAASGNVPLTRGDSVRAVWRMYQPSLLTH